MIVDPYFEQRCSFNESGCLIWNKSVNGSGYGQLKRFKTWQYAHRLSWEMHIGPISKGLDVLHKCDVRRCVNPEHLFLGTASDNMLDASAKGRIARFFGSANPQFLHGRYARRAP
jgi:hypothetical protein